MAVRLNCVPSDRSVRDRVWIMLELNSRIDWLLPRLALG